VRRGRLLSRGRKMRRMICVLAMMLSVTLLVVPAGASDYALGIYGNANMDDTIDEGDIAYVEGIIEGTNEETELADANYDGCVDDDDIDQIEMIISGVETEITFIDSLERAMTINKPITSIVVLGAFHPEAILALGATDKIVGIDSSIAGMTEYYTVISKLPNVGKLSSPDIETILELDPDIVLTYGQPSPSIEVEEELKDVGIPMVRLSFYSAMAMNSLDKLGYILDKEEEARENHDYVDKYLDIIKSRTEGLSDDEKPKVFMGRPYTSRSTVGGHNEGCIIAGGINIATDIDPGTGSGFDVDSEWLLDQDPDIILRSVSSLDLGYTTTDVSGLKEVRDEIINLPEMANVSAVKNGDVYLIGNGISYLRGFIGTIYMAKWFHPELFEDLDPEEIHKEYLERFEGIPYQGVYVYPSMEEC
jgi:iron complex transport system substrate-binding protein